MKSFHRGNECPGTKRRESRGSDSSYVSVWPDREISRGTAVAQGGVRKCRCTCS